jgi:GH25 family lysozyme M1 (1,4-beta-N-acetylmuramidase)
MDPLTITLNNHGSTDLTLKSVTYGSSAAPSGDAVPGTIAANTVFSSSSLRLPATAIYVNQLGTELTLALTATAAGDAWTQPSLQVATPPQGEPGPVEDSLDTEAFLREHSTRLEINVFDVARLRFKNSADTDLVLTSSGYTPLPKGDTLPRVVPPGETKDCTLRMWPKSFANYALKDTNWNASWLLIWWDEYGSAKAQIQSPGLQSLEVSSDTPPPSRGRRTLTFTVSSRGVSIPVAPISGKFQMTPSHGPAPLVGMSASTRRVFGIDISWFNAKRTPDNINWSKICNWVDQDERRIWFAIARATMGDTIDSDFIAYWQAMSKTRLFRSAYHYPYPPHAGETAIAAGRRQGQAFMAAVRAAGGWRQYDLPPAIDLEYGYNRGEHLTDENAYNLLVIVSEIIREMSVAFSAYPLLYCNTGYFGTFYAAAKRYYEAHHGAGSWDDAVIAPFVSCPKWIFGQWSNKQVDFSTLSFDKPAGYTGPWDSSWNVWQWGILSASGTLRPGPPDGAVPDTTARTLGQPNDVDMDVWNGDLDSLAAFASRTRWNV